MRAARLPGSGPTRRTVLQGFLVASAASPAGGRAGFTAIGSVSYVTIPASERGRTARWRSGLTRDGARKRPPPRADSGEQLWLRLPPEQCRWYDPETQLLLEAKE